jgi:hypothetical protein
MVPPIVQSSPLKSNSSTPHQDAAEGVTGSGRLDEGGTVMFRRRRGVHKEEPERSSVKESCRQRIRREQRRSVVDRLIPDRNAVPPVG